MEREVSEVDRKLLLKKNYLDKIRYYLTRNPISQDELYFLVRKFFTEYLKLDYEFTYEELSQELNKVFIKPKVKEHIDMFLIRLSESEYLEETVLGTADINNYLRELDDIIRNMIFDDQPVAEESPGIIQKVLKRKSSDQDKQMDLSAASALIDEINYHITNGNTDTAKNSYVELSKIYDKLEKDDKKKIHDDMNEVYVRLQTLIKNPKSVTPTVKQVVMESASEPVKSISDLIEETQYYINASNVDSAKKSYSAALKIYESLSSADKKSLHPKVNGLYAQLQGLSPQTINVSQQTTSTKATSTVSNVNVVDEKSLSFDLPELEPIPSVSNKSIGAQTSQTSTPPIAQSKVSTASFVEDFGKSIASSSTSASLNDMLMETKPISSDVDSNAKFDFSAPIGNNDIEAESITFQANNPTTDEIDLDQVAPASDAPNMLFTAGSAELKSPENLSLDVSSTKPVNAKPVSAKTVKEVKEPVAESVKIVKPLESKTSDIKPDVASKIEPANVTLNINPVVNDKVKTVKEAIIAPSTLTLPNILPETVETKTTSFAPNSQLSKLDALLKKINDDIVMEKLDKAKETYKDALMIYRSLRDSDKVLCYTQFFTTFKKLDDTLHQKSLHTILDEQLLDSTKTVPSRPVVSNVSNVSEKSAPEKSENYTPESTKIVNVTTLPIMLSNDPDTTRVYELIEESYFNIDNRNADLAMLKYFKAVEFYRKLSVEDKRKAYADLYRLFQKISIAKKVKH